MRVTGIPMERPGIRADSWRPGVDSDPKNRVTEIISGLSGSGEVDRATAEELFPVVYDELRRLARARLGRAVRSRLRGRRPDRGPAHDPRRRRRPPARGPPGGRGRRPAGQRRGQRSDLCRSTPCRMLKLEHLTAGRQ